MKTLRRREFLIESGFAGLLMFSGPSGSAESPKVAPTASRRKAWRTEKIPADWHQRYLRRFMVGQHLPDRDQGAVEGTLRDLDPVRLVREVRQMGAQVFSFYAKCHRGNAYYPTRVGHRYSLLGERDLFGEMIEACLDQGIVPSVVYEMADLRLLVERPEWCHRNLAGRPTGVCFNGPYGRFVLAQLEEIFSGYPVFEILLDMLDFPSLGPDWKCPFCEERFRKDFGRAWTGKEADLSAEQYVRYVDWRCAQIAGFLREVKTLRDRLAPGALLEHNFHGVYNWEWGNSFKVTSELTDAYFTDIFAFRDGLMTGVLTPKLHRTHSRHRPVLLIDGPVCLKGDTVTPKPLPFYLAEAGCVVSHGLAYDSSICLDHTGTFDPAHRETIRRLNAAIAEREPWIHGGRPETFAALVFPERTQALIGKRKWWPYADCLAGWAELLVENHVLFDMLVDYKLAEIDLARYGLIVLPDMVSMSRPEVAAIRSFVAAGGTLVATAETSLADEKGRRGSQFQLADVLGLAWRQSFAADRGCLVLTAPPAVDPDPAFTNWICYTDEGQVETHGQGAKCLGVIGMRPSNMQLTPMRWKTDTPALTVNRFGRGQAYYFAGRIGGVHARYNYPGVSRLIGRLMRSTLEAGMRLLTEAPGCVYVEASRQQTPARYVVHLMNAQSQVRWQSYVMNLSAGQKQFAPVIAAETLPVRDVRLGLLPRSGERVVRAYQVPGERPLTVREESGRVWTTVPVVRDYDLVVFDVQADSQKRERR
jgi:hypothetical protein